MSNACLKCIAIIWSCLVYGFGIFLLSKNWSTMHMIVGAVDTAAGMLGLFVAINSTEK